VQVEVQDIRLSAESQGDGPAVVFVHGLGATSSVWHAQRMVLSRNFRIITFDLSGSGRSDKSKREYSVDAWAEEMAGLLDRLDVPAAVVVGHSMGTLVGQRFAARFPDSTLALVLAGALTELPEPAREVYRQRAALVEREGIASVADVILAGALTPATRESNPALAGLFRDMVLSNDPACYAGQCRALVAGSARADQLRIACPTLLLVGDQDTLAPLAVQQQIAATIAGSRLRIVPGTAHMTMLERPELFNAHLLEFLSTSAAAS
jgi:pimeloyl-ACP methyl ester carboxylesterase